MEGSTKIGTELDTATREELQPPCDQYTLRPRLCEEPAAWWVRIPKVKPCCGEETDKTVALICEDHFAKYGRLQRWVRGCLHCGEATDVWPLIIATGRINR